MTGSLDKLINYPPNGNLTKKEVKALEELKGKEDLTSALRKILASATADVFFDIFNVIDGTADPDPDIGNWTEVMIVDKPEDLDEHADFLHDAFYDTYWDWKEKREDITWSLDDAE